MCSWHPSLVELVGRGVHNNACIAYNAITSLAHCWHAFNCCQCQSQVAIRRVLAVRRYDFTDQNKSNMHALDLCLCTSEPANGSKDGYDEACMALSTSHEGGSCTGAALLQVSCQEGWSLLSWQSADLRGNCSCTGASLLRLICQEGWSLASDKPMRPRPGNFTCAHVSDQGLSSTEPG